MSIQSTNFDNDEELKIQNINLLYKELYTEEMAKISGIIKDDAVTITEDDLTKYRQLYE